jgi:dipeptidase E
VSGHVVAIGGGAVWERPGHPFDPFIISLARRDRPRVCYVGTAGGDSEAAIGRFYRRFAQLDCRPVDLTFFPRAVDDLAAFVRDVDVFWVGGGSTANLLSVWRLHGLDELLRAAHDDGAVLAGISAGMNCWFEASTTDSFGPTLAPLHDGLGLLAGSACPHYDGEPQRRPLYRRLVDDGFPPGYAVDDEAALHFAGGELVEAIAAAGQAGAYRIDPGAETPVPTRLLPGVSD